MTELQLRMILALIIASPLACGQPAAAPSPTESTVWSDWSNGMRMRVAPVKPVFRQSETPSFVVQFQAQRTLDVSIPYLLPSSNDSVIGPFTTLEVWVTNIRTGARYQDRLSRLSLGRSFALVPEGTSLQRLSPGHTVTTTFLLSGELMPAEAVETLKEARQRHWSIAIDRLPKSLQRLPPGKYTVTLTVRPCPLESQPDYLKSARRNPPERYRDVWVGALSSGPVDFEVMGETPESTGPASRKAQR